MPTDSLRMARIHPGHNGPPPSSNVIPEPVQNRVKVLLRLLYSSRDPSKCSPILNWVFIVDIRHSTWRRFPNIPIDYFDDKNGIEIEATLSINKSENR